jgi:hypothetical protein
VERAPLKKGDIVKPMEGRRTSDSIPLKHIFEAKVTRVMQPTWGKTPMEIRITKGNGSSYYGQKGNVFSVFTDGFELANESTGDYSLW